jgi:diguanylate cyclase (GGDEF)-like protein
LLELQERRTSPTEDRLTGLPLRAAGIDFLRRSLGPWNPAAGASEQFVGAIAIDIDRLKQINDTLGATAGDAVLRQTARRFAACLRPSDLLVRAGKDEFLVFLPNLSEAVQAESIAHRLLECMQIPFIHRGGTVFATASFGLALSPPHGNDPESLVHSAEHAVKEAKRCGRGNYRTFEPAFAPARSYRQGLEIDLHQALEHQEFLLHYQPQVDESGRVVCVEALLRWLHPRHGFVPPDEFIPLAEASGLILPIGEWVLGEACRQGTEWIAAGIPPMRIAVNVSTVQFARPQFLDKVARALAGPGFDARFLELEITESSLMLDHEAAREKIARLQSLGVTISIDDFGMGYSSLAYLQRLPVNALKVDRNFVSSLDTSASALPLLAAIIMLAHSLNLEVVVEGVETDSQRDAIWSLGADKAQGYLFARPQAPAEVVRLFRSAGQRVA